MTDVEGKKKFIVNFFYYGIIIALCFLLFKYAMGTLFPLIFAYIVAIILQKPKKFIISKTPIKKGFASTICVLGLLAVAVLLMSLIGVRVTEEIKGFIDYVIIQFRNIDTVVNVIETEILSFVSRLPDFLSETLRENVSSIFAEIRLWLEGSSEDFTSDITSTIGGSIDFSFLKAPISGVISTARQIPSTIIAVVVSIVAACFITADYDMITDFVKCQLSEKKAADLTRAITLLKSSLGKMGKAYILIIIITFTEMCIGLYSLKLIGIFSSNYIAVIALATAIVDIIPVLGTGTILLPWTAYSLIVGNYSMALGLGIIYATITVIRQIIEPKLVAGQLGLPPFITVAAIFIGLKIFGVLGMFIAPMIIIMLKLLNDEGILHLWNSPSKMKAEAEKKDEEKDVPQAPQN